MRELPPLERPRGFDCSASRWTKAFSRARDDMVYILRHIHSWTSARCIDDRAIDRVVPHHPVSTSAARLSAG